MRIKTSELTGVALDWAVAKCWYSDRRIELTEGKTGVRVLRNPEYDGSEHSHWFVFFGSTYWEQGGPILQNHISALEDFAGEGWTACCMGHSVDGNTPLEAICRAYVTAKLGDEVEVPEELQNG